MSAFRFDNVDANEPKKCIEFLDAARSLQNTQRDKQRTYEMLEPSVGQRILDVGCGTGEDICAIARMVGESGVAVGIDASQAMITEAMRRADFDELPVSFHCGDVYKLPFDDGYFHSCRAERLLHFLEFPESALREMARVTMQSGRILIAEPDWDSLEVIGANGQLSARILDANKGGPSSPRSVGGRLSSLMKAAGFFVHHVETARLEVAHFQSCMAFFNLYGYAENAVRKGCVSWTEVKSWVQQLRYAAEQERLCCALTSYIVIGTKQASASSWKYAPYARTANVVVSDAVLDD